MERQLSVWAAPGLILFLALLAFVFGHPPGKGAPREQSARAPVASEAAPPPPAEALPAAKPIQVPPPKVEAQPKPPPAKPAESKPVESKPAEPAHAAEEKPSAPSPAAAAVEKTGDGPTGKVVGRIVYEGTPPPPAPHPPVPEKQVAECCAAEMDTSDRTLRVSADGGVADVVVTIKAKGAEAAGAGQTFEMDQKCCSFEPHVLLVPAGATVRYRNSDGATHNVHLDARKNAKVNNNLAAGSTLDMPVPKDDQIGVSCDIHTWMKATVIVSKYATAGVSGADGRFEIDGVPPGEWTVEIWSERAKPLEKQLKVAVQPGATTTVEWRVAAAK